MRVVWLVVSHEVVAKLQLGLQSSEDLTEAREFASKMVH